MKEKHIKLAEIGMYTITGATEQAVGMMYQSYIMAMRPYDKSERAKHLHFTTMHSTHDMPGQTTYQ